MNKMIYLPKSKILLHFKKSIINKVTLLLFLLFFVFTTTTFAQGTTCATAETLVINGACDTGANINDTTQNIPNATGCSFNTFQREGWYTFTVAGGPLNVVITANASNRNLFLQLISSTSSCTGLSQINCANADTANNTAQTETITTSLANGIYYIKVINNGGNNNMSLTSICVTSPVAPANNLCTNATPLPCGTTNLAGTTVNTADIPNTSGCSMSNYGVWYTFVGDGNPTTITTNPAFDIKLSVSTGTCASMTNIVCTDSSPETATFTTLIGTTYYVYVAGWLSGGTTTGAFTISRSCVTCAPPTATAATNITFTTATVNWTAPTAYTPSNGYQYAVTTSATPPGSGTATAATTANITGLTANTVYYLHVRSDCGANGFSTWSTISFVTGYCISNSSSSSYWISNFSTTLGSTNINRNSTYTAGGYANYSGTDIVSQIVGQSFNFSTTMSSSTHGINIYVDWNNDFDFDDAGELVYASGSYVSSATGTITIPPSASVGNHRMRVVTNFSSTNPSSCGSNTYTETEDYTINAVAPPACSGTPTGGTAIATPASASPGSSYTVSASGFTVASGLTFQWQYSTTGSGGPWINQGASSGTYSNVTATAPALGTTVLWHLIVTCTSSGQSGTSTNGTFTSVSTQNIPTTGNNTVTCGTNIVLYDNGGVSGDYANSSTGYTVLEAGLAATITLSGNYVTESIDYIRIYNGTGTGGTLLASYSGTGTFNYTGTAGQTLTIQFYSDSSVVYSGFNISVSYSGVCFPACAGTPTGGTVIVSPNTTWPGNPYTVSATGYTQALNMTYQWQYSTTGSGGPWINAGIATSSYADYNATAPASGVVLWHLIVTCTNSSSSATSSNGTFTTMAVSNVLTGCPNVVSGGLGLNGADPAALNCSTGSCVDLEATYLDLGNTTNYIVEPIAYNPPRAFNGLANPVSVSVDDVWSPIVNLPFNFCFYGNTYNQCVIGSNGILSFNTALAGTSSGYSFNNNIPISGNTVLRENSIFGVFHDINPGVSGQVGWELITLPTGCRALVASWSNVPMFDENAILYTGMMVLYENSNVIEVYIREKNIDNFGAGTWNDGNAIVGIQNATGTLASVAPGRNGLDPNWTSTNEAWRFVPSGSSIASINWYEGAGTTGPIVGTTPTINVCPSATTTYTAEITYTLCNGSTIKESDQTIVTVSANKTWNGATNTNWNTASNWTPASVPVATEAVLIPNTVNKPIVSGGASALACNLTIQNGGSLTINPTNTIKVTNAVTVAAGGSMIIENTGSLVQINNVANSGNIQYKRNATVRRQDYVYWSSPVASFASNAVSPGTNLGYQYKWIPTIGTNTGEFGNWTFANETMILGKGYCLRAPDSYSLSVPASYTATFTGVPNNGNITTPISRGNYNTAGTYSTGVSSTPGTRDDDNWNLVGNPYPSAIHAIKFLTLNPNIAGFVNIWTHGSLPSSATADPFYNNYAYNYTPTDYITYNSTGTSSGAGTFNGFIGGGQGFFISMLHGGATTQNLVFDNTLRRDVPSGNTYNNDQFFRTSNKNSETEELEKHRIWFDLVTPSGTSARALLGYVENATDQNDRLFDAFSNEKLSFNIFSLIEEDRMLIQGRKLPFDVNDKVNIGVSIPQDGLYKIALGSVDGLFLDAKQNIYLEDKLLNVVYNLKEAPYSFMGNKGTIKDRFIIRYTKSDNIIELTNQVTVYDNNVLTVESGKLKIKDVVIFDTLGKLLLNKNNVNNNNYQITNLNKTNSMLIVKVTLEDNSEEVRKVIY